MPFNRVLVVLLAVALLILPAAKAQSVTGQISGTVTDPAGAVIGGAAAQLTNDLTKQERTLTTESSGSFIFLDLVPGNYTIQIALPGFKTYSQHGNQCQPEREGRAA